VYSRHLANPDEVEPINEDDTDIPEVEIIGSTIKLAGKNYDLLMCYLCPLEKEPKTPLIAYWKIRNQKARVNPNIVGRALRDSGFGGYRFFESAQGQGFEYDSEKDPRKRHQHGVKNESYYGYSSWGNNSEFTELWVPFLSLNPIFSINHFFAKVLDPNSADLGKNHIFVTDIDVALNTFIKKLFSNQPQYFKITEDKMGHGKPLFFFNLVAWETASKNSYSLAGRITALTRILGEDAMSHVNTKSKWEVSEDD